MGSESGAPLFPVANKVRWESGYSSISPLIVAYLRIFLRPDVLKRSARRQDGCGVSVRSPDEAVVGSKLAGDLNKNQGPGSGSSIETTRRSYDQGYDRKDV